MPFPFPSSNLPEIPISSLSVHVLIHVESFRIQLEFYSLFRVIFATLFSILQKQSFTYSSCLFPPYLSQHHVPEGPQPWTPTQQSASPPTYILHTATTAESSKLLLHAHQRIPTVLPVLPPGTSPASSVPLASLWSHLTPSALCLLTEHASQFLPPGPLR